MYSNRLPNFFLLDFFLLQFQLQFVFPKRVSRPHGELPGDRQLFPLCETQSAGPGFRIIGACCREMSFELSFR